MIHIQSVFTVLGEGNLLLADGSAAFSDERAYFEENVGPITSASKAFEFGESEFKRLLLDKLGLNAFANVEEALDWAEGEMGDQKIIGHLEDPKESCKEYLEDCGWSVFEDRSARDQALREQAVEGIGGGATIHKQYAQDTLDKMDEYVAKHGWLCLHDLIDSYL